MAPNSCQYPLFYDIASFPDGRLLKLAKGAVCHEAEGSAFGPPNHATHLNFHLAHPTPDNVNDLTPGSTYDGNTEILPLITQSFVHCNSVVYIPPNPIIPPVGLLDRGLHFANRLVARLGRFLLPGSAYAIDQGQGGGFLDFGSPFNNLAPNPPNID